MGKCSAIPASNTYNDASLSIHSETISSYELIDDGWGIFQLYISISDSHQDLDRLINNGYTFFGFQKCAFAMESNSIDRN